MATRKPKIDPSRAYNAPPKAVIIKHTKDAARQIQELWAKADGEGKAKSDSVQHMIDLFTGEHDIGMPEANRYVSYDAKSNKPADVIFRVMGMLLAELRCQYISPSTKPDDREKADAIEAHLNSLYPTLFRRNQERWDVHSLFWQLLVGQSYLQQSYLPYYWDKNELSRRPSEKSSKDDSVEDAMEKDHAYNDRVDGYRMYAGPPIVVESLDPRMVREVRTKAKGVIAHVKKYRVTRYDFADAFRERGKGVQFSDDGKVKVRDPGVAGMEYAEEADTFMAEGMDYYEYIDAHCVYYVVGDEVVDRFEHKGGIRIFPAYGLQTGLNESHLSSVGILWPVRNEVVQLDFNRTLWAQKAYIEVFPQLFAILEKGDDPLTDAQGAPVDWDLEPGTIKQIRGRLENPMRDAAAGTDFRAFIEMQAQEVDLATISGLARGVAGAQQPGYSINQLSQAMRTLWKGIIESRQLQLSSMYEHYLWMVKNVIKNAVATFAESSGEDAGDRRIGTFVQLKPDDIDDYFRVEADLNPELPIDLQGQITLYWMLFKEGGATWEEFVRKGKGQNNPVAQQKQIRFEAIQKEALPQAIKDGIALGQMRMQAKILKEQGFPELNETFSSDVQKLKAARAGQSGPAADVLPAGPAADGQVLPMAAPGPAGGGTGIPPTGGMNPGDSSPGPRMGDLSSGNGLR